MPQHQVKTVEELQAMYGPVSEASTRKEVDHVHPLYRALICDRELPGRQRGSLY